VVPSRLSLVSLGVRDVRALRAFYERLGWTSDSPEGEEFAAFPLGGAVLALYRLDLLAGEAGLPLHDAEGTFKGFTLAINCDTEEQVDAALAAARDAGATVLAEPVTRDWGGRSGYFADPEGNAWEIAWLPGAAFDERGGLIWPF
jgi:catechol 2,3-dioxygenase-like lactoylglutathione lyase family enzyme